MSRSQSDMCSAVIGVGFSASFEEDMTLTVQDLKQLAIPQVKWVNTRYTHIPLFRGQLPKYKLSSVDRRLSSDVKLGGLKIHFKDIKVSDWTDEFGNKKLVLGIEYSSEQLVDLRSAVRDQVGDSFQSIITPSCQTIMPLAFLTPNTDLSFLHQLPKLEVGEIFPQRLFTLECIKLTNNVLYKCQ